MPTNWSYYVCTAIRKLRYIIPFFLRLQLRLIIFMRCFLSFTLTSALLLGSPALANERFDQLMDKGWDEWDQENFKEAIKLCSNAIDIEPTEPEGYYCRGTALSET